MPGLRAVSGERRTGPASQAAHKGFDVPALSIHLGKSQYPRSLISASSTIGTIADQVNQAADLPVAVAELVNPLRVIARVREQSSRPNPFRLVSQQRAGFSFAVARTNADHHHAPHQHAEQNRQRKRKVLLSAANGSYFAILASSRQLHDDGVHGRVHRGNSGLGMIAAYIRSALPNKSYVQRYADF